MALLRAAFAVVFAFVSLAHGPVMTFAQAHGGALHHQDRHHQDHAEAGAAAHLHGHHGVNADARSVPPLPDAICYSVGCFASLASPVAGDPDVIRTPAGKLLPPAVRALLPATMDPAEPPPRLQA